MSEHRPQNEPELIKLVRSLDERAPTYLHERLAALVAESQEQSKAHTRSPLTRLNWRLGSVAAAVAVVAITLVLSLTGTGGTGLTLREASALTLEPATMAAPSESASRRAQLDAAVEGISFPYWTERFGWRAVGAREDKLAGRTVRTIFYAGADGRRIGYAIVAGSPAPKVEVGTAHWHDGTPYRLSSQHGAAVVTWLRDGRLCVVSGRGVSAATLLALAGWDDHDGLS
jgi:hypothetical protein